MRIGSRATCPTASVGSMETLMQVLMVLSALTALGLAIWLGFAVTRKSND